jgi:hypothetical protein
LYFAVKQLFHDPNSSIAAEYIAATEECVCTLEYCAASDTSAQEFLKHIHPLLTVVRQLHPSHNTKSPEYIVQISNNLNQFWAAVPSSGDFTPLQQEIGYAVEALVQAKIYETIYRLWPISERATR